MYVRILKVLHYQQSYAYLHHIYVKFMFVHTVWCTVPVFIKNMLKPLKDVSVYLTVYVNC